MKQSTVAASPRPAPIPVAPKPSVWGERSRRMAMAILPYIVLVVLWQIIATTQPAYVFPPLGAILKTAVVQTCSSARMTSFAQHA